MRSPWNRCWRTRLEHLNRSHVDAMIVMVALIATVATADSATGEAPHVSDASGAAVYHVTLSSLSPPKLTVTADLPVDGQELVMDQTRPAGIPEMDSNGWPALVTYLRVSDTKGGSVGLAPGTTAGWKLEQSHTGRLTIDYEVDYSLLASHEWPAPRESGLSDADHLVLAARSIFITTGRVTASIITFTLPDGWRAVTPWESSGKTGNAFSTRNAKQLVENLVVLTRHEPDAVTAGGFHLQVTSMGHWLTARADVRRVLRAVVPRLVGMIGSDEREEYLVVLLPALERGGESYRNSFAMTTDHPPTRDNDASWGGTLTHEIFHYWNGWRLTGADYTASQWFHEGFTEYAANVAMVTGKVIDRQEFLTKLSEHVGNYGNLTTTLEAFGSRKGPPLYSGGALVAFSWDVLIRYASGGKRDLSDFAKRLWQQTEHGRKPYAWPELEAALQSAAPYDWDRFYNAYVKGSDKLPLDEILPLAGLRLEENEGAGPRVMENPSASAASKRLWESLVNGH